MERVWDLWYQSLGLSAAMETLIKTCSGPGLGMCESMSRTFGPAETRASFIIVIVSGL